MPNTAAPAVAVQRLSLPLWALGMIESFGIWQIGIVYYASGAFSAEGGALLPVTARGATLAIALGYVLGAALAWAAPRQAGRWSRALTGAALGGTLLLLAPLPPGVSAAICYLLICLCVTLVGACATLYIDLYDAPTLLRALLLSALLSAPAVVALHEYGGLLGARALHLSAALIQLLMLVGLHRIPCRVPAAFLPLRADTAQPPLRLLGGTGFLYVLACLCMLFSSTAAEGAPHGTALYYLGSFLSAALFALLRRTRRREPLTLYTLLLALTALGYILRTLPLPWLRELSILLQGAGATAATLVWCFPALLFERFPCRALAPLSVLAAMAAALLHAALVSALPDNPELLYALQSAIALTLLLAYFLLLPAYRRLWHAGEAAAQPPESRESDGAALTALTAREREVAQLAARGLSTAQIAGQLCISEHTVKDHSKSIYRKLGVHNRGELAARLFAGAGER